MRFFPSRQKSMYAKLLMESQHSAELLVWSNMCVFSWRRLNDEPNVSLAHFGVSLYRIALSAKTITPNLNLPPVSREKWAVGALMGPQSGQKDRSQNEMLGYLFSQHPSLFCQESMLTKFAMRLECQLTTLFLLRVECAYSFVTTLNWIIHEEKTWHRSKCWMVSLTERKRASERERASERQRQRQRETETQKDRDTEIERCYPTTILKCWYHWYSTTLITSRTKSFYTRWMM